MLTALPGASPGAQELQITSEVAEIAEDFGYPMSVTVVNNRYSGFQDLVIKPAAGSTYETESFMHAACAAVAQVTAQSPTYQTHIDMIVIDIEGELWAVSSETSRKAFSMTTEAEQKVFLKRRLQRIR
jgi:hypothetical protein